VSLVKFDSKGGSVPLEDHPTELTPLPLTLHILLFLLLWSEAREIPRSCRNEKERKRLQKKTASGRRNLNEGDHLYFIPHKSGESESTGRIVKTGETGTALSP